MTENNESSDRLVRVASPKENRLERLVEQQIINTADITQQIKEAHRPYMTVEKQF